MHYIWNIAIHEDEEPPIASHFYFNQRPRRWYEKIVEHGASIRESENLLFYLKPAWALADALAYMRTGHRFCSLDANGVRFETTVCGAEGKNKGRLCVAIDPVAPLYGSSTRPYRVPLGY